VNINESSEIIQFLHSGSTLQPTVIEALNKNFELDLF
jgi:hypothetical protein